MNVLWSQRVVSDSPAERSGIQEGDVVIAVNGVPVRGATQLRNRIGLTPIGNKVELTIDRNGETRTVTSLEDHRLDQVHQPLLGRGEFRIGRAYVPT